jgi:PTS system ascorbate-specific IIA component
MSVGLLLITHQRIGHALLEAAASIYGTLNLPTRCLAVPSEGDVEETRRTAAQLLEQVDQGAGVLILADIYGSTPSNVGRSLLVNERAILVTGVNLPMLVRVLNYPDLSLPELADKACTGAQAGVMVYRVPASE